MTENKVAQRRRFSQEFKRQVVEETLGGGASVAGVALRHHLNANLVFNWRRKHMRALGRAVKPVAMLPVTVVETGAPAASEAIATRPAPRRQSRPGAIEIEVNGACIRLKGMVDAVALRVVLDALIAR